MKQLKETLQLNLALMKKNILPSLVILFFGIIIMSSNSCKKDENWDGCVYGKIDYRGTNYYIGCMNRVEFKAYLDSPTARAFDPQTGPIIDKEISWVTAKDCSECEQ